jgi:hypothetical protein
MAEVPSDVRFPPGNSSDFDTIFQRLVDLKELHFPEHTARDLADPYIQLLVLMASMGQHGFGRMNYALKQLSPRTATSRQALMGFLPIVNRALNPVVPAQGPVYGRIRDFSGLLSSQVIVEANQRIAPTGEIDPIFSVDEELTAPSTLVMVVTENGDAVGTSGGAFSSFTFADDDSIEFSYGNLAYDGVKIDVATAISDGDDEISWEFRNSSRGSADNISNQGTTLLFSLNTYLKSTSTISANPIGLSVQVTHRSSGITETVLVTLNSTLLQVETSFLGQSDPSLSVSDYELFAEWLPIRDVTDASNGLRLAGEYNVTWPIDQIFSKTATWDKSTNDEFQVRARRVNTGLTSTSGSDTVDFNDVVFSDADADMYVVGTISQGFRRQITVGNVDDTLFQFLPAQNEPLFETTDDVATVLVVGDDEDWEIVEDFSESGSDSKHAVFMEDPVAGWGIMFGDGTIGTKPTAGESVKITIRTDSLQPGNIDALSEVRAIGGLNLVDKWTLYDGTDGYTPKEAHDRQSVLRFRANILPQLSLRAESVVTDTEIVTALTTITKNRPSFTTSDGRSPFSRAFFTTEGAGNRQYRVVVAGSEKDSKAGVLDADLREAETWLNGEDVGSRRVGGVGVNNTEGVLSKFVEKSLNPAISITVPNPSGIRDQIDQIIQNFFRPHSRDDNEEFRWKFGGNIPVALLFGLVWNAVPSRTNLDIEINDGSITFDAGDVINLLTLELPVLSDSYDKHVNIIIIEGT